MKEMIITTDALDDVEFTELMQTFRDAPKTDHKFVVECFDKVKRFVRKNGKINKIAGMNG